MNVYGSTPLCCADDLAVSAPWLEGAFVLLLKADARLRVYFNTFNTFNYVYVAESLAG
ncbi:hypothetical protein PFF91_28270 [Burkholderia cenocepacia]|uniref:hypothetical protein n=1 Tax=Burkholderia cepacia complex TaxID=87882 RepID=UPI0022EA5383|nr:MULTISPECIES: hypothetical protein [Burkholderia cepacia complex]MDA3669895.1 hypothetical protein [Burkholderia cenocepacia]MDA3679852.1 hypothetical protein [Burkholderia cenocepacia]MDA3694909.1 hypothetical protein [Burkholderia cenocepacia]